MIQSEDHKKVENNLRKHIHYSLYNNLKKILIFDSLKTNAFFYLIIRWQCLCFLKVCNSPVDLICMILWSDPPLNFEHLQILTIDQITSGDLRSELLLTGCWSRIISFLPLKKNKNLKITFTWYFTAKSMSSFCLHYSPIFTSKTS